MHSDTAQGAHVSINARSEADLDVAAIKKLVAKSSGAAYSNHKEQHNAKFEATPAAPVKGAYQNPFKAEGVAQSTEREQFWATQEADEAARKKAAAAAQAESKAQLDVERVAREKEAEAHREQVMQQRLAAANVVCAWCRMLCCLTAAACRRTRWRRHQPRHAFQPSYRQLLSRHANRHQSPLLHQSPSPSHLYRQVRMFHAGLEMVQQQLQDKRPSRSSTTKVAHWRALNRLSHDEAQRPRRASSHSIRTTSSSTLSKLMRCVTTCCCNSALDTP